MENYKLPADQWDPDWGKTKAPDPQEGLKFSRSQTVLDWIILLEFTQGDSGGTRYGTGFYVNIPGAEKYVILTAGHNLIDTQGRPSQNLKFRELPEAQSWTQPASSDIFISAPYRQAPNHSNAANDYGAILVSKGDDKVTRGFGFALRLGHTNLRGKDMTVSGFRGKEENDNKRGIESQLKPVQSTGKCRSSSAIQLQYEIATQQGMSGSPVYMAYKGHETVVAIHNNGQTKTRKTSMGTRLNDKVLDEILSWVKVGYQNRSLKGANPQISQGQGLYLRFRPKQTYAWVQVDSKDLNTSFDVIPAYAPTANISNQNLYAFRLQPLKGASEAGKGKWVYWDVTRKGVTLVDDVEEMCCARLVEHNKKKGQFRIVLDVEIEGASQLMELQIQARDLKPMDKAMGQFDIPGVSFEKHVNMKPADGKQRKGTPYDLMVYNDFVFE